MASGVPIIAINPIPGQEEDNAKYLESNDLAIWIKKDDDIEEKLKDIIYNTEKLKKIKKNIKKQAKPKSVAEICEIIIADNKND